MYLNMQKEVTRAARPSLCEDVNKEQQLGDGLLLLLVLSKCSWKIKCLPQGQKSLPLFSSAQLRLPSSCGLEGNISVFILKEFKTGTRQMVISMSIHLFFSTYLHSVLEGTTNTNIWEQWGISPSCNRKSKSMLTWWALAHTLCWGFGMWKVKPPMPPALTVISLHVPLSKPEKAYCSSTPTSQANPGSHASAKKWALITGCVLWTAAVPPQPVCAPPKKFLHWDLEHQVQSSKVMTALESPFPVDPKANNPSCRRQV